MGRIRATTLTALLTLLLALATTGAATAADIPDPDSGPGKIIEPFDLRFVPKLVLPAPVFEPDKIIEPFDLRFAPKLVLPAPVLDPDKSTIPGISSVTNPQAATGGSDAESTDQTRVDAPRSVRAMDR
jgi:hypothetical protein